MLPAELYAFGQKLKNEGKISLALDAFNDAAAQGFGLAHLELHNFCSAQGNIQGSLQHLLKFMDCPLTGNTIDLVQKARQEIASIQQRLNPQPQQAK